MKSEITPVDGRILSTILIPIKDGGLPLRMDLTTRLKDLGGMNQWETERVIEQLLRGFSGDLKLKEQRFTLTAIMRLILTSTFFRAITLS